MVYSRFFFFFFELAQKSEKLKIRKTGVSYVNELKSLLISEIENGVLD